MDSLKMNLWQFTDSFARYTYSVLFIVNNWSETFPISLYFDTAVIKKHRKHDFSLHAEQLKFLLLRKVIFLYLLIKAF